MRQNIGSLDHLIDQIDMAEPDKENVKIQIHRAEAVVDAIEACTSGIGRLLKPLTHLKSRLVQQH